MDFFLEPTGSDEDGDVVAKPAPSEAGKGGVYLMSV